MKAIRMKTSHPALIILVIVCVLLPNFLMGQIEIRETENVNLIYFADIHEYLVPHVASCYENALKYHQNLFQYEPGEKVTVFLKDFSDYGNAGATPSPRNLVLIDMAPLNSSYETMPTNERINAIMNHEMVHIVTMDQAARSETFFRSLFAGKVRATSENPASIFYSYLTNPRMLSPRWYLEGIAVFLETWMAGGFGRAMGAYDEMVFRSMVRDSSYFYDIVGLESEGTAIDFQVGANSYLYGTRFFDYLAYSYGPEKLIDWTARVEGSKMYYAKQFKHVYGKNLESEWSRWIEWEHKFQKDNLQAIRENPTTPFRRIFDQALGSVSPGFFDPESRKLFLAVRYPGQVAHIAAIQVDTGQIEKICDVKDAALYYVTSLTFDPDTQTLYYTTDNKRWRDLNSVNVKTGEQKRLMQDVRTGDLAFNPIDKSTWGVRHVNGISTLVRIPYPYQEWNQIHSFPFGRNISGLDISPDGSTLTASLVEVTGLGKLIKLDTKKLLADEVEIVEIFDFEDSLPEGFVFSPDGRYLFGSSYYSGVSNIYRYDFEEEDMDIVSNCESGFFRPVPVSDDSLIVMRYTGQGFVPVMIPNQVPEKVSAITFLGNEVLKKHPVLEEWMAGSPAKINIDSMTTTIGSYHPAARMRLESAYPIVEGYKNYASLGYRINLSDLLFLSRLNLTASYSPDQSLTEDERIHLGLLFGYWDWEVTASYNGADFYDLFGPTKTSRKGYSLGINYKHNYIYDKPRILDLKLSLTGYGGMERLPDFQNVQAIYDKMLSAKAKMNYEYIHKSLGSVDEERGIRWQLNGQSNYVNSELFPRIHTNLDYGFPLPLKHSSLWFRSSTGLSFGDKENPFANFFFGGFGNNWIDYQTEKRYRNYYGFPGASLNAVGGRDYGKLMVEWNLPPIRFKRFGLPDLYIRWARPALFASGIRTNLLETVSDPDEQFGTQRTLLNTGVQVDFELVMFSRYKSMFSLGYAVAAEEHRPLSKEFMISLKIL